jgi:hypothetical protein
MQFAMFAIAITNEPNIATVGDVVIQVGVGVTGRLPWAQRDGIAWEGDWSSGHSDSTIDHNCDADEDTWWAGLERE